MAESPARISVYAGLFIFKDQRHAVRKVESAFGKTVFLNQHSDFYF